MQRHLRGPRAPMTWNAIAHDPRRVDQPRPASTSSSPSAPSRIPTSKDINKSTQSPIRGCATPSQACSGQTTIYIAARECSMSPVHSFVSRLMPNPLAKKAPPMTLRSPSPTRFENSTHSGGYGFLEHPVIWSSSSEGYEPAQDDKRPRNRRVRGWPGSRSIIYALDGAYHD